MLRNGKFRFSGCYDSALLTACKALRRLAQEQNRTISTDNTPAKPPAVAAAAEDWQFSHTENDGKTHVLFNMNSDPDDSSDTFILVKGRNAETMAQRLVALLKGA